MNGFQDRAIQRKIERNGEIGSDKAYFFLLWCWDFEGLRFTCSYL